MVQLVNLKKEGQEKEQNLAPKKYKIYWKIIVYSLISLSFLIGAFAAFIYSDPSGPMGISGWFGIIFSPIILIGYMVYRYEKEIMVTKNAILNYLLKNKTKT